MSSDAPNVAPSADGPATSPLIPPITVSPPQQTALNYHLQQAQSLKIHVKKAPIKTDLPIRRLTTKDDTLETLEAIGRKLCNTQIGEDVNSTLGQISKPYDENNLRAAMMSDVFEYNLKALRQIREHLCEEDLNQCTLNVLSSNFLPMVKKFLGSEYDSQLQYEACWCITNVAAGKSEFTRPLVDDGFIPLLVDLLHSEVGEVSSQAAWALGNISGDCEKYRDVVLFCPNIIQSLLGVPHRRFSTHHKKHAALHISVWAIANLCRWKSNIDIVKPAYSTLKKLIMENDDHEVLPESMWAVCRILNWSRDGMNEIVDEAIVQRMIRLLRNHRNYLVPTIRAITNILASDGDEMTEKFVSGGLLVELKRLLRPSNTFSVRIEAILAISNVAAGPEYQVEALMELDYLTVFLELIAKKSEVRKLRREACFTVANMCSRKSQIQIARMVHLGIIPPLIHYLSENDFHLLTDYKIVQCLGNIIDSGEPPKSPYQYPATVVEPNQHAELIKSSPNLLASLYDYLARLEGMKTLQTVNFDDTLSCDSFASDNTVESGKAKQGTFEDEALLKNQIVDLLKQVLSGRFRDSYVQYCQSNNALQDLMHGLEAFQILDDGSHRQIDPSIVTVLNEMGNVSISSEGI